ncbi:MAG: hypothetical protein QUS14_03265 [Pyrinomonadaceae bacterium]|nr:hypothetical protein [Pyrinomonadaceae bacterium]
MQDEPDFPQFGDSDGREPVGIGKVAYAVFAVLPNLILLQVIFGGMSGLQGSLLSLLSLILSVIVTIPGVVKFLLARKNNESTKFWKIATPVAALPLIFSILGFFVPTPAVRFGP